MHTPATSPPNPAINRSRGSPEITCTVTPPLLHTLYVCDPGLHTSSQGRLLSRGCLHEPCVNSRQNCSQVHQLLGPRLQMPHPPAATGPDARCSLPPQAPSSAASRASTAATRLRISFQIILRLRKKLRGDRGSPDMWRVSEDRGVRGQSSRPDRV